MIIFILTIGFYGVNSQKNNKPEIAKTNNELNSYEVNTKIESPIIQTSVNDIKVSPNASIILKKHYKNCGHTTKDYAAVPEELVNKTEEEVKNIYSDWRLQGFSPNEIVLYKEVDGICNEHYLVKEIDGVIRNIRYKRK